MLLVSIKQGWDKPLANPNCWTTHYLFYAVKITAYNPHQAGFCYLESENK
jgi:hypothetical protein